MALTTPPCSYYVLREDMLAYYLGDLTERLPKRDEVGGWEVSVVTNVSRTPLELNPSPQELEATLHCIMSIQEAVPLEPNQHLSRLFSPEILGQLPVSGGHRIRRTVLGLIGTSPSGKTYRRFTNGPPKKKRFLRFVVHNPPCGLEGTPAHRPELRGARAERGEPLFARRQRAARSVRCEPCCARAAYHCVWRTPCGACERAGYGEGEGAAVHLERHTSAPARRRDTPDRGLWHAFFFSCGFDERDCKR
jgi:hypothetical protein